MFHKILISILLIITFFYSLVVLTRVHADDSLTPTPTPSDSSNSQAYQDIQNKIADLTNKINDLQGQEKTFSSQIAVMDSQIKRTEYRIESTKQQILNLVEDIYTTSKKISSLNSSLTDITKVLMSRIVATYQVGSEQPLQMLLSSDSISNFVTRANYLKLVQAHDKKLVFDTVQAKNDYANQQQIFENKKKQVLALQTQLQQYNTDLDSQKAAKQSLLAQTQGSEANYEQILAQTKAQLASFRGFVTSQGGASLLGNQTVCDDWGCYYNQRDSQWGGQALNGTGYTLADSGCLLTSMAMVYTHYGHKDVNPISINSVSSNFGGIPAALLKYTISANGVSASRARTSIDSVLSGGDPVIVGISYDGGPYPDHFIVLRSGANGSYIMNDPFTANGHAISFTSHYSISSIREVDRVVIN